MEQDGPLRPLRAWGRGWGSSPHQHQTRPVRPVRARRSASEAGGSVASDAPFLTWVWLLWAQQQQPVGSGQWAVGGGQSLRQQLDMKSWTPHAGAAPARVPCLVGSKTT